MPQLNLHEIKVKSFVTHIDESKSMTIIGGSDMSCSLPTNDPVLCVAHTSPQACPFGSDNTNCDNCYIPTNQ